MSRSAAGPEWSARTSCCVSQKPDATPWSRTSATALNGARGRGGPCAKWQSSSTQTCCCPTRLAMSRLLLVDKSAFVRGAADTTAEDELCVCAVTRMEVLYSARSPAAYTEIDQRLAEFRELRMDAETFAVAMGAQRELAVSSRHRVPIPDLLIAACAHQHGADVLHVDRHFDVLASVLNFTARRA